MIDVADAAATARRRAGRPRSPQVPQAIRDAARTLFAERGFVKTSVRDIATLAGCDPAVVIRHFGTKEKLFLEAIDVAPRFDVLNNAPLASLGHDVLWFLVRSDDAALQLYRTLLGALDRPEVRTYFERSTNANVVQPLARRLTGPDAELRAQLIAAQIGGLLTSICVMDSHARELMSDHALHYYAEAIQTLVDADNSANGASGTSQAQSIPEASAGD